MEKIKETDALQFLDALKRTRFLEYSDFIHLMEVKLDDTDANYWEQMWKLKNENLFQFLTELDTQKYIRLITWGGKTN